MKYLRKKETREYLEGMEMTPDELIEILTEYGHEGRLPMPDYVVPVDGNGGTDERWYMHLDKTRDEGDVLVWDSEKQKFILMFYNGDGIDEMPQVKVTKK